MFERLEENSLFQAFFVCAIPASLRNADKSAG
jgi:hypothetical protein